MNKSVYIRPQTPDDALTSYKWRNNPVIWKHTGSRPDRYITPEIEKEWLENVLKKEDNARFAICIKPEDRYIGNIFLTDIANGQAFLHIFIGEIEYWGKGRAIEAIRQIFAYAFGDLQLDAVYGEINPDNKASLAMATAVGFKKMETPVFQGNHSGFTQMIYTKVMYDQYKQEAEPMV